MPRPTEIAADARALYGPPAVRPAAGAMGDGALWVDPGDNQSLWQVQSGNWVRVALPPTDDDSSIPAGVPVLRGPYVADYTHLTHDGDALTLLTPQAGDVLLRLFVDIRGLVQWEDGILWIGQNLDIGLTSQANVICYAAAGDIAVHGSSALDNLASGLNQNMTDGSGALWVGTASVLPTADPVRLLLTRDTYPEAPPVTAAQGHVSLYALVARPVAP